jgi:hypothetical protein
MNISEKKNLQIVFISHEQNENSCYLASLLKRHPGICVFDGTDQLIDNLLKFPNAPFGIHNTVFFELLFELINDKRFLASEFTPVEFEEVAKSKNCYEAFLKLMRFYCIQIKPAATILAYRFPEPVNFKKLFSDYIVKDLRAKYIHQLKNVFANTETANESSPDNMLSAICNGILQVKQKDFINNYEYEYKRLFRFLNSPVNEIVQPEKKNKKLYKKTQKLAEVQNSWFRQIVSENENKREKVLVGKVFND